MADPFAQVYADAESQLTRTLNLLDSYKQSGSTDALADVNNAAQELAETIHDLSQSIGAMQSQPMQFGLTEYEINHRVSQVGHLNERLANIQESITEAKRSHHQKPMAGQMGGDGDEGEQGASGQDSFLQQQVIEEQDQVLDSVYTTVNSLREQANVMSRELEDQSYLIEDFDRQVDTAGDRLRRGIKKINWVVKNNEDTLSSCCISLLILVLVILLVMLLIV
uniref:t-SNARE affecting a late Golgi compartment protein 1 n=1 Tax=Blastobotrys adeninivorans TaxID=409370 RepID=A0A060SYH8_BLAAD